MTFSQNFKILDVTAFSNFAANRVHLHSNSDNIAISKPDGIRPLYFDSVANGSLIKLQIYQSNYEI